MIKPMKISLSEILEGINSKTLMITCNEWNEGSHLKSNQNIALMSVLGMNLGSAGQYTLHQALAVKILKYEQIFLLANYPSKVQDNIIREFGEDSDKYAFATILAKTKIELKKDGLVFSDSLFSEVAYLKYQINCLLCLNRYAKLRKSGERWELINFSYLISDIAFFQSID